MSASILEIPGLVNAIAKQSNVGSLISLKRVSKVCRHVVKPILKMKFKQHNDIINWFKESYNLVKISNRYENHDLQDIGLEMYLQIDEHDTEQPVYRFFFPFLQVKDKIIRKSQLQTRVHIEEDDDEDEDNRVAIEEIRRTNVHVDFYTYILLFSENMLRILSANKAGKTDTETIKLYNLAFLKLQSCISSIPSGYIKISGSIPSLIGGNTQEYVKYSGQKYRVKTGSRGGKFIEVNGSKIYMGR